MSIFFDPNIQTNMPATGPGGRPLMPGWQELRETQYGTGAKGQRIQTPGLLGGDLQLRDPMGGKGGRIGWQLLQKEAQRTGPSQLRQIEEQRQMDLLNRQGAGQMQQNLNRMAMTGGLRGGAAERMGTRLAQQQLMQGQDIRGQLASQDAQRQWQAMQALPQAELAESQFQRGTQQYNIDKALAEQFQKRAADLMAYKEQMRAWAAERTARATPSSDGGKK